MGQNRAHSFPIQWSNKGSASPTTNPAGDGDAAPRNAQGRPDQATAPPLPPLRRVAATWPAPDWALAARGGRDWPRGWLTSGGGVRVLNWGSMGPLGLSRAGLWLSRAMSRCVLEPRLAGKRWLVSGVGDSPVGTPGP